MSDFGEVLVSSGGGGSAIGMFHSEGYGFQGVHSGIGYKESLGSRKLINWLKVLVYTRQTGNYHSQSESKARSCRYSKKENPE